MGPGSLFLPPFVFFRSQETRTSKEITVPQVFEWVGVKPASHFRVDRCDLRILVHALLLQVPARGRDAIRLLLLFHQSPACLSRTLAGRYFTPSLPPMFDIHNLNVLGNANWGVLAAVRLLPFVHRSRLPSGHR